MELTRSFLPLLQNFDSVFTVPTYITFVALVTGWILSHRHRYVTEVIFPSGNVGKGHWCRFHWDRAPRWSQFRAGMWQRAASADGAR